MQNITFRFELYSEEISSTISQFLLFLTRKKTPCWIPIRITIQTVEYYSSGMELAYLALIKYVKTSKRLLLYDSEYYIPRRMETYRQFSISWVKARYMCAHHYKGDLLIIDTREEYKFIQIKPRMSREVCNVRDNLLLTSIIYIGFTTSQVKYEI